MEENSNLYNALLEQKDTSYKERLQLENQLEELNVELEEIRDKNTNLSTQIEELTSTTKIHQKCVSTFTS